MAGLLLREGNALGECAPSTKRRCMTQDLPATLRVRLGNVLTEHGTTYELERDRVRKVISKYAHGLPEAELEDRVSATFLALLRKLDSGEEVRKLENFLVKV